MIRTPRRSRSFRFGRWGTEGAQACRVRGLAAADRARAPVRSCAPRAGGVARLARARRGDGLKRYPPLPGLVSCVSDARGRRERACPRRNPGVSDARRGANARERDGSRACGSPRARVWRHPAGGPCPKEQARKKGGLHCASALGKTPRLTVCSYECDSSGRKRKSATSSRGTDRFPNAQLSREKPKE